MQINQDNQDNYSKNPVSALTKGYVLALLIIAAMTITIHVIMDRILVEQDLAANIVSKSSAETTQIHKLVNVVTEYYYTRDEDLVNDIDSELASLKVIHNALVESSKADQSKSGASHVVKSIYFEPPHQLDSKVTEFMNNVEKFSANIKHSDEIDTALYRAITKHSKQSLTDVLNTSLVLYDNAFLTKVEKLRMVQIGAILVICITLVLEAFAIFMPLVARVRRYADRLREISMTDMLTGIGNRRYFVKRAQQEIRRAERLNKDLCLCMLDIDHFKAINDQHGHAAGDYVLREFVEIIKSAIRLEDDLARIGGEEFILLLPASDIENALIVAERVRQRLEERPFVLPETNQSLKITASFGLAQIDTRKEDDVETAMGQADEALYMSKEAGRNRVYYCSFPYGEFYAAEQNIASNKSDNVRAINPA